MEEARRLLEQEHPAYADRAALEARLRRIARLYEDGLKSEAEYTREVGTIRARLAATPIGAPIEDLGAVAAVLGDLSWVFAEASVAERRAVLFQLVDQVYLRHDALLAIRPTGRAWPLLKAVHERMQPVIKTWAGWAPDPRDDTLFTFLLPRRLAA